MLNQPVVIQHYRSPKVFATFKGYGNNMEEARKYVEENGLAVVERDASEELICLWVVHHPRKAPREPWKEPCEHRIEVQTPPRPVNGLNIEIATPQPRCIQKPPKHIKNPEHFHALRWILSGGDPLVFGRCSSNCPKLK